MSTTSTATPKGGATRGRGGAAGTCKGGTRLGRAAAVIEARRAETGGGRFQAYRCASCLLPNGSPAWHVRRVRLWRRLVLSER